MTGPRACASISSETVLIIKAGHRARPDLSDVVFNTHST